MFGYIMFLWNDVYSTLPEESFGEEYLIIGICINTFWACLTLVIIKKITKATKYRIFAFDKRSGQMTNTLILKDVHNRFQIESPPKNLRNLIHIKSDPVYD